MIGVAFSKASRNSVLAALPSSHEVQLQAAMLKAGNMTIDLTQQ
ncbi:MAG: hypothetical protein ACOYNF_05835 [Rhodoferax sp.]